VKKKQLNKHSLFWEDEEVRSTPPIVQESYYQKDNTKHKTKNLVAKLLPVVITMK
jgi:hypothetical protein